MKKNKRLRQDGNDESDILRELQRIKGELATIKSRFQQQSTIIMDLNSKVLEMEQLLGNKNCEIAELKEKLNDQTTEINKKHQEQFNDKQERVDAIIKIALQAIINYRTAIRTNRSLLKSAARRVFSPIWSARRHPIYQLIEIADELQLMQLHPNIRDLVEKHCVLYRSGLSNQHQGLDAILEEVNKTLKSLIPSAPQLRHWKIAARNLKKIFR